MSAVKFDKHDEINKLQAKIMLDTGIKLSKKELLEILFDLGSENYEKLIIKVKNSRSSQKDNIELRKQFIAKFSGCIEIEDYEEIQEPKRIWEQNPEE